MGCWGYGIMESDGALDYEVEFQAIANVSAGNVRQTKAALSAERQCLEASLPALLKRASEEPVFEDQTQFRAEAYQVLAYMLMRAGCALSDEQRNELLIGLQDCYEYRLAKQMQAEAAAENRQIEEQDLVRHDQEPGYGGYAGLIERLYGRMQAIDEEASLLRAYPIAGGVPVEIPSRGLFEVMAKHHKK